MNLLSNFQLNKSIISFACTCPCLSLPRVVPYISTRTLNNLNNLIKCSGITISNCLMSMYKLYELIKKACFCLHILNVWEKNTIHVHVKSEYEVCLWNKSRSGVPLTRKLLCTCRYGTPQHQRCRQKAIAACDTDWINNISVNRIYNTRLLAISSYRGKALDVWSGSFR